MPDFDPILSIVLPAYEEAENLSRLIPALHQVASRFGVPYEIAVVDAEGPRDSTPEVCAREGAKCYPRSRGELYGHAIRTAQEIARGRYIILMDADGSHSPEFLLELWEHRDAANMVIASRYVRGGKTDNPPILILMSVIVNLVFRAVLQLKCADVSNSFRLYQGDEFRTVKLECNNFDVVEEILVKLFFARGGYVVKEVPFTFEQRKAGKTKRKLVSFAMGYLATLARLYRLKQKAQREQRGES